MDPRAIEQARARVAKAGVAVRAMESADSMAAYEAAWSDFLAAANTVYTKLEEGSHCDGKSKAWFGRMKHVRRKDELLNYIHHARNSDEHSIEPVARPTLAGIHIEGTGKSTIHIKQIDDDARGDPRFEMNIAHHEGEFPRITFNKVYVKLLRVRSLQKDWFEPPTSHLEAPLTSSEACRALDVAQKGLAYLEWLVQDGAKYAK